MSHETHDLIRTLDSLGHPRVLVLGDLILDRYTWGNAERISQEAPVLVLRADKHEARLGGAASVCHLLRGLEAQVTLVGVLGDDDGGRQTRTLLSESGVDHHHVLSQVGRPSTVKTRFIGRAQNRHPHQILRVDSEVREPISESLQRRLLDQLIPQLAHHQVVLVSDYGKGVCTPWLLQQVMHAARRQNVPVVVDPIRSTDYSPYRGATYITPNRLEAQTATGIEIRDHRDVCRIGAELCRSLELQAAVITLDREGMTIVPRDGGGVPYPTRARNVYDITGAGDMVLATLGLCVAAGTSLGDAVRLGNVAGGLEVEKLGCVAVTRDEIREDILASTPKVETPRPVVVEPKRHYEPPAPPVEPMPLVDPRTKIVTLPEAVAWLGRPGTRSRRVVFTNGCFDLLHIGHTTSLREAASTGDVLVVGLNSDRSVRRLKGEGRPIISERARAEVLAELSCVDYVIIFDEDTPRRLIEAIRPDVLVKGGTYKPHEIVGADVVASYGGEVRTTNIIDGVSTTNILNGNSREGVLHRPYYTGYHPAARRPA